MAFCVSKQIQQASPAQECAIHHGEGPMLVLAGPGSGKTFVITHRIRALIEEHHIDASRILVITFTKAAAQEMKGRFNGLTENRYPVQFGTFHAIFYHILQQSSPQKTIRILSQTQKIGYIKTILRTLEIPIVSTEEYASLFLRELSRMKNSGCQMTEYEPGYCDKRLFQTIAGEYERRREAENAMDFDDILYACYRLLAENPLLCGQWQQQYSHLLIDEFQDINEIQYQIVRLLTGEHGNLFAVGDDDQSIYGFRGSSPTFMKRMLQEYPACRQTVLSDNYRCSEAIVEAAGKVIAENKSRIPKEIRAKEGHGKNKEAVRIKVFSQKEEERKFLIEEFKRLSDEEQKHTAVIFRTNRDMSAFAQGLVQNAIPFLMKEKGKSIFRHFIAEELLAYLRFADGNRSRELFYRFMNHPYRGIPREALSIKQVHVRELAEALGGGTDRGFACKETWKLSGDLQRLGLLKPYAALQYICRGMGYEADLKRRLQEKGQEEDWQILSEILESARGMDSLAQWQDAIEAYERKLEDYTQSDKSQNTAKTAGIRLLTLHAAKGLEYDRVYLPGLNEGTLPHKKSVTDSNGDAAWQEKLEEERRMLYVGMTRAKKGLCLSYLTGTKEKPEQVSRFLKPLL